MKTHPSLLAAFTTVLPEEAEHLTGASRASLPEGKIVDFHAVLAQWDQPTAAKIPLAPQGKSVSPSPEEIETKSQPEKVSTPPARPKTSVAAHVPPALPVISKTAAKPVATNTAPAKPAAVLVPKAILVAVVIQPGNDEEELAPNVEQSVVEEQAESEIPSVKPKKTSAKTSQEAATPPVPVPALPVPEPVPSKIPVLTFLAAKTLPDEPLIPSKPFAEKSGTSATVAVNFSDAPKSSRTEPRPQTESTPAILAAPQNSVVSQKDVAKPEIKSLLKPAAPTADNNAAPAHSVPPVETNPPAAPKAKASIQAVPVEMSAVKPVKISEPALPRQDVPVSSVAEEAADPVEMPDGTVGALQSTVMKRAPEKADVVQTAGSKPAAVATASSIKEGTAFSGNNASGNNPSGARQDRETFTSNIAAGFTAKPVDLTVTEAKAASVIAPAEHAAAQAEKIGRFVNQQVTVLQQTGSQHLSVSLKLDAHTELTVNLTSNNGQIAASISCARGSMNGLEAHWKDLQDSLAKQNVQLAPAENKTPARSPAATADEPKGDSSTASFSQNSSRQSRDARREAVFPPETQTVSFNSNFSDKPGAARTVSQPGWESWA